MSSDEEWSSSLAIQLAQTKRYKRYCKLTDTAIDLESFSSAERRFGKFSLKNKKLLSAIGFKGASSKSGGTKPISMCYPPVQEEDNDEVDAVIIVGGGNPSSPPPILFQRQE